MRNCKTKHRNKLGCLPQEKRQAGFQVVELLASITIAAIFSAAIFDSLAKMHQFSTSGQNQIIASDMAQQIIDNARNSTFATLLANVGTQSLLVNRNTSGETGPTANPRPLLQDRANMTYCQRARDNDFNGTAAQTIADIGNNMVTVTANIQWTDGTGPHTYQMTTTISSNGIHN